MSGNQGAKACVISRWIIITAPHNQLKQLHHGSLYVTVCACGVWCRVLTSRPLYVGPQFGKYVHNNLDLYIWLYFDLLDSFQVDLSSFYFGSPHTNFEVTPMSCHEL